MKLHGIPVSRTFLILPLLCSTLLGSQITTVSTQQVWQPDAPAISTTSENTSPEILRKKLSSECLQLAQDYEKDGNATKAIHFYKKALDFNPDDLDTSFAYANLLYAQNNIPEAIDQYKKALLIKSDVPSVHYNLGVCLEKKELREEAAQHFQEAIRLKPEYTGAYLHVGNLLKDQKKQAEALTYFEKGLKTSPTSLDLIQAAAGLLKDLNRFDEAIAYYRMACEQNPRNLTCLLELGNTLNMMSKWPEALECYKKILDIRPNTHEVLYNFGYTLKKMGFVQEAIDIYDKVLQMSPEYPHARFSRSLAYLSLGDFTRGWPEYEWRWQAYNESPKKFPQPVWDGSNPAGKTILVYAEQGLGDTFQFIRYAKCITEQGGTVIAMVQKPLKKLLSLCPYLDSVITPHDKKPDFDSHIALMSLPMVYKTEMNTIPVAIPYLYAREDLVELWRTKLATDKNFKIGLCWQGNPFYSSQFLRQAVAGKSMHAKTLLPLASIKGITLYSLQKMSGADQLDELKGKLDIRTIPGLDEENGPFMDTAAIMKNLDLMITIDTSMAHIAGGLGIPTWCMLPEPADWRWMLKRLDTPWFPNNMRLFRQPTPGDWDSVIKEIAAELQKLLDQRQSGKPQTALLPSHAPVTPQTKPVAHSAQTTQTSVAPEIHVTTSAAATPPAKTSTPLTSLVAASASLALATQKVPAKQEPSTTRPTVTTEQAKARATLEPFIPTPFSTNTTPANTTSITAGTTAISCTTPQNTQATNKPASNPACAKPEVAIGDAAFFQYCDPIAELVDKLTTLAVKADDGILTSQEKTEYDMLQKRYVACATNTPELEQLKNQLQAANKQSFLLNKKSTNLQEVKKYLKKKIADLGASLSAHA